MPIKIELSYGEQIIQMPDVDPSDHPRILSHFDPISPHIVVISCNADDTGGMLYTYAADESFIKPAEELEGMTDGADIEAIIAPNNPYQRDLQTRMGLGVLSLRHFEK